jgi:hypothetical protein
MGKKMKTHVQMIEVIDVREHARFSSNTILRRAPKDVMRAFLVKMGGQDAADGFHTILSLSKEVARVINDGVADDENLEGGRVKKSSESEHLDTAPSALTTGDQERDENTSTSHDQERIKASSEEFPIIETQTDTIDGVSPHMKDQDNGSGDGTEDDGECHDDTVSAKPDSRTGPADTVDKYPSQVQKPMDAEDIHHYHTSRDTSQEPREHASPDKHQLKSSDTLPEGNQSSSQLFIPSEIIGYTVEEALDSQTLQDLKILRAALLAVKWQFMQDVNFVPTKNVNGVSTYDFSDSEDEGDRAVWAGYATLDLKPPGDPPGHLVVDITTRLPIISELAQDLVRRLVQARNAVRASAPASETQASVRKRGYYELEYEELCHELIDECLKYIAPNPSDRVKRAKVRRYITTMVSGVMFQLPKASTTL